MKHSKVSIKVASNLRRSIGRKLRVPVDMLGDTLGTNQNYAIV